MSVGEPPCGHYFHAVTHNPIMARRYGWMWLDRIDCNDCPEEVVLRVYDDPRDDPTGRSNSDGHTYKQPGGNPT